MSSPTEIDQIRRAAAGDRLAQSALVQQIMPMTYRVAFRMLRDAEEAEDVTQETFLRLWKALPDWQPRAKLSTWACTVALNLCRDRLRKKKPMLMDALPEQTDPSLRPEEALASQQFADRLDQHISALPERQREALMLCAIEGFGNQDAAQMMNISVRALESLLARARRSLRHMLGTDMQTGEANS